MSCNNSTFSSNTFFIDGNDGGTRLLVQIADASCTGGVTAGDTIHYDSINSVYVKSKADNPPNSEVFGIVESVNADASKNVVIYGSINLPSLAIEDIPAGSTGAGGGSDIYFLSPDNAGKIRNTIPIETTQIVKPIYQVAPHGNGSYTGIVVNYIGYKVPSEITVFTPQNRTTPVGTIDYYLRGVVGIGNFDGQKYIIPDGTDTGRDVEYNEYSNYLNKYPRFHRRFIIKFEPIPIIWIGNSYPMWDPTTIAEGTQIYIHDKNGVEQDPLIPVVNWAKKKILLNVTTPLSPSPDISMQVGGEYFFIKNPEFYGIGGFRVTDIYDDTTEYMTFPYIEETLRMFTKQDQFDFPISSALDPSYLTTLFKIKNTPIVNTITSLQTNELNTKNFDINNQDLTTLINDLESRIATAEQEINK